MLQETKYKVEGKLKIENYKVFELLRPSKMKSKTQIGGGLAIGCLSTLKPVWVREGGIEVESISINIHIQNIKIRCCVAYGPQENVNIIKKEKFWNYLNEEVHFAKNDGAGFILQFDGNLWAGKKIIPNDPHKQNQNGKYFEMFLKHNNLSVVNSLNLCEGLITRSRSLKSGQSQNSVLDFFVVCQQILPFVTEMFIDDKGKYQITNYIPVKMNKRAVDSDHAILYMDLNVKIKKEKPIRKHVFNFKHYESQQYFKKITSETLLFTECFRNDTDIMEQIKNWQTTLFKFIGKSFKVSRVRKKKKTNQKIAHKMNVRYQIKQNNESTKDIDKEIFEEIKQEQMDKIMKNLKLLASEKSANINTSGVWKFLKKFCPKKSVNLPGAKFNHMNKLISDPEELKKLLLQEYTERLRRRPLRPDLRNIEVSQQQIFSSKMKYAENVISKPFSSTEIWYVLKTLKNNISRDNAGLLNELFKPGCAGGNLISSLEIMFNKLKQHQVIPNDMLTANVTTIPKTGSKMILSNQRGIFRTSVLRNIYMRLIYNRNYHIIDTNMSECNIGGRRGRSCRDNIFIINAIKHDVLSSSKKKTIIFQIYDFKQMFDGIVLEEGLSDIFDVGIQDDSLKILYEANKKINMSVKTEDGLTDRKEIFSSILQGDTWGTTVASVQSDNLVKHIDPSLSYRYKSVVNVLCLGQVDDIIGVTEAGVKSQELNATINIRSAFKRLQFNAGKCKTLIVGKSIQKFESNALSVDSWKCEYSQQGEDVIMHEYYQGKINMGAVNKHKYLGHYISNSPNNMAHLQETKKKYFGLKQKTMNILKDLNCGKYFFECGILFLKTILRPSLLYSLETCHNMTENELRFVEKWEEDFLRDLLNTLRSCPRSQLYLECSVIPARFQIMKNRLMFFHNIKNMPPSTLIFQFVKVQELNAVKGDWIESVQQNLHELKLHFNDEELKNIPKKKFSFMIDKSIKQLAFKFLLSLRKYKGSHIEYNNFEMADYLRSTNYKMTIVEKQELFAFRNLMYDIPANFASRQK